MAELTLAPKTFTFVRFFGAVAWACVTMGIVSLLPFFVNEYYSNNTRFADGHIRLNTPDLFRPPKLSRLEPV